MRKDDLEQEVEKSENNLELIQTKRERLELEKQLLEKLLLLVGKGQDLSEIVLEKQKEVYKESENAEKTFALEIEKAEHIKELIDEKIVNTQKGISLLEELQEMQENVTGAIASMSNKLELLEECKRRIDSILQMTNSSSDNAGGRINNNHNTEPARESPNRPGDFIKPPFDRVSFDVLTGNKVTSFEIGEYYNGSPVVKGEMFEKYISDYYNSDSFVSENLNENSYIETIDPGRIEGIRLSSVELNNAGRFWSQHKNGGTAASFLEIASHIPEVEYQLKSGRNLSSLKEDPYLGMCTALYFEQSQIPRVAKCNGYYEFVDNGRHRLLAARELGYNIRVKVVEERRTIVKDNARSR